MRNILFFIFAIFVAVSCDNESSSVLSSGEMEDIIYDIHVSQCLRLEDEADKLNFNEVMYRKSILNKYGVSEEEWDSSFTYYCRHTEKLHNIYLNVSERLRRDILAAGGEIDTDGYSDDTTNVWNLERSFVLLPNAPYNLKSYDIKVDSTFKVGDRVTLSFDTKFIYQDGMRDIVASLVVVLQNDSVVSQIRHVTSDNPMVITVDDTDEIGIKGIKGYFMMFRGMNDQISTTLRMGCVSNVRLSHVHKDKPEEGKELGVKSDSLSKVKNDTVIKEHIEEVMLDELPEEPIKTIDESAIKHPKGIRIIK